LSGDASPYKPGETIACKILENGPGGYSVFIPKDNLRASLVTNFGYKVGEEVRAKFVCIKGARVILEIRMKCPPGPGAFMLGRAMVCEILDQEPRGYSVHTVRENLPGLLNTCIEYQAGQEVEAEHTTMYHGRVILADLYRTPRHLKVVSEKGVKIIDFPRKMETISNGTLEDTTSGGIVKTQSSNPDNLDNIE
jgi:hypothetical protein